MGVHKAGFDSSNEIFSNSYQKQIDKNHPYRPYINLKQFKTKN